ncbi:MAG: ribosome silencing factor [Acidobacteriota bacterium]|nr:ribosome silencing factor [Acidobacteriota bacterium]MDQ2978526.1 ribosome silencing factor [Acidobacteriota bacterium]
MNALSARDRVREGLSAALDKNASAVLVFNLTGVTTMADYFVLSTANSDRQARAISDAITEALGAALSVEGHETANWILMDYGDVVFHVFQEEARRFYALERLWGDAENETGRFAATS